MGFKASVAGIYVKFEHNPTIKLIYIKNAKSI